MKIHNIPSVQYLSSMLYVLKSQWRFKPTSVKYAETLRFGKDNHFGLVLESRLWGSKSNLDFCPPRQKMAFKASDGVVWWVGQKTRLYRSMRPRFWHPVDLRADSPISHPRFDTKCVFCGWNQLKTEEFSAEMRQQRLYFRLCPILTNDLTLKVSVKTQLKFCGFRSF